MSAVRLVLTRIGPADLNLRVSAVGGDHIFCPKDGHRASSACSSTRTHSAGGGLLVLCDGMERMSGADQNGCRFPFTGTAIRFLVPDEGSRPGIGRIAHNH